MKYNGPFDQPGNPDASYVSGNPRTGTLGSIPPAEAFEHPQREIINFFQDSGVVPDSGDLHQLSRSFQVGRIIYGTDTGTENNLVVVLSPVPAALVPGMTLRIKKSALANTGGCTLNVGLGSNVLVKAGGAAFNPGDLLGNMMIEVVWDGATWQTINYIGIQSSTNTVNNFFNFDIPYCVDTSLVSNTIIAPFAPAITSIASGDLISVKLNKPLTGGPVLLNINNLPSKSVKRGDNNNPIFGDGVLGQILLLEFDGVNWQIVNNTVPGSPLPVCLADEKPRGTHCGSFISGDWRTRDLNVVYDPFGLVAAGLISLANNRITLAAGKWILHARAPAIGVSHHQCRWWNWTHRFCHHKGHFHWHWWWDDDWYERHHHHSWSFMDGLLDLDHTQTFEFHHRCWRSRSVWGFGRHGDDFWFDVDNRPERYAVVYLTKVS